MLFTDNMNAKLLSDLRKEVDLLWYVIHCILLLFIIIIYFICLLCCLLANYDTRIFCFLWGLALSP